MKKYHRKGMMKMERTWKTLNDYFPNIAKSGVFSGLNIEGFPWYTNPNTYYLEPYMSPTQQINYYYHTIRSGNKVASEALETFSGMWSNTGTGVSIFTNKIGQMLLLKYKDIWLKRYATMNFEYNPIENYDMNEEYTQTNNGKRTPNLTKNTTRNPNLDYDETIQDEPGTTKTITRTPDLEKQESTTRTPNITETETTTNVTSDSANNVYGFNSNSPVPNETSKTTRNGEVSTAETGTEENETRSTETGTETTTESIDGTSYRTITKKESGNEDTIETETGSESTEGKETHTLKRSGNIGVTTSQQMIQSERELWNWNFLESVFEDIDRELTCNIW